MFGKRKNLLVEFLATELHVLSEHTEILEQGWDWRGLVLPSSVSHFPLPTFPHTGTRETG